MAKANTLATMLRKEKMRRYIIVTTVLLVILIGLLFLLYLFTRPPVNIGGVTTKGYTHLFSIYGASGDRLYRPADVAVDKNGNIYVADTFKHRIMEFDSKGKFIRKFGVKGSHATQIELPSSVVVAPDGRVYVFSSTQGKIVVFRNFKPYWVIGAERPLAGTIKKGRLYITTDRGIMIGDLNGKLITTFGQRGRLKGFVDMPNGVAVDDKGIVYVTDSMNYRIQAFNTKGKSLWTLGKPPKSKQQAIKSTERSYGLPTGMAIDEDGYLYFVDALSGEIVIVDSKGKEVKKVGEWGHDDGQFYYPGGIAYAGDRKFVIADKFNDRVQVISIPSPVAILPEQLTQLQCLIPIIILLILLAVIVWYLHKRGWQVPYLQKLRKGKKEPAKK